MVMRFITVEELLSHCVADGDDTDNIERYGEAAEQTAENHLNRALFVTTEDQTAAREGVAASLATAKTAYDAAVEAADGDVDLLAVADAMYRESRVSAFRQLHGMVINESIRGAILMIAAHNWGNRADVVAGSVIEVPLNSTWVLNKWRYLEGTF